MTSGSSPHLDTYTTETLTFNGSSTQECFDLILYDSSASASYTLALQNVGGGNNAQIGGNNTLGLTVGENLVAGGHFCGIIPPLGHVSPSEAVAVDRFGNYYSWDQLNIRSNNVGSVLIMENCGCEEFDDEYLF